MTKIYGASDDLIEVDGDLIADEVDCYDNTNKTIKCSDNTIAKITYDEEGQWRIEVLQAGNKLYKHFKSVGDDGASHPQEIKDCPPYSDVLVFEDGLEWVKIGNRTFKA